MRCTATPNRGIANLVSLPNSFNHSLLLRITSADVASLNRIAYPVFVVPMPATLASWAVAVVLSRFSVGSIHVALCVFLISSGAPVGGPPFRSAPNHNGFPPSSNTARGTAILYSLKVLAERVPDHEVVDISRYGKAARTTHGDG